MLLVTGIAKIDPTPLRGREARRRLGLARVPLDHAARPAPGDRRLRHGDGDRGARELRHRLHRDRRRAGPGDDRAGPRDLSARLRAPAGRARLRARHRPDGPRHRLHPAHPVGRCGSGADEGTRPRRLCRAQHSRRPDVRDAAAVRHHVLGGARAIGHLSAGAAVAGRSAMGQLRQGIPVRRAWTGCCSRASPS